MRSGAGAAGSLRVRVVLGKGLEPCARVDADGSLGFIACNRTSTVASLKQQIWYISNDASLRPVAQSIWFKTGADAAWEELARDTDTLSTYGIRDGATVIVARSGARTAPLPRSVKVCVATRLRVSDAGSSPDMSKLRSFVKTALSTAACVAVAVQQQQQESTTDLAVVVADLLKSIDQKRTVCVPVTPWGISAPLHALLRTAMSRDCDAILYQSLEVVAPVGAINTMASYMQPDTLVVGAALPGHAFRSGQNRLSGMASPWNTLALWDVRKLSRVGFSPVSDGGIPGIPGGMEEVAAISTCQKIRPDSSAAKLISFPSGDRQAPVWDTAFPADPLRRGQHAEKLKTKNRRAAAQLRELGIGPGTVRHIRLSKGLDATSADAKSAKLADGTSTQKPRVVSLRFFLKKKGKEFFGARVSVRGLNPQGGVITGILNAESPVLEQGNEEKLKQGAEKDGNNAAKTPPTGSLFLSAASAASAVSAASAASAETALVIQCLDASGEATRTIKVKISGDAGEVPVSGGIIAWQRVTHARILAVNDVYELDNLSRLKTAVAELRTPNTWVTLAGDFLSPSLLSSIDKGEGMVKTLNECGIDYVCFGNHEADISHPLLLKRVKESQFVWINTNMQKWPGGVQLPTHAVLPVRDGDSVPRKIALLGLNTEDPGLYKAGAFNGATIEPIATSAAAMRETIVRGKLADVVVPMTHQVVARDRAFAEKFKKQFPAILGGHDHDVYHEVAANGAAVILKTGADAKYFGVCDLFWRAGDPPSAPLIETRLVPASDFKSDAAVDTIIESATSILRELEAAALCKVPKQGIRLSSRKPRLGQVSIGTLLVSRLRDAMSVDCAIVPAGMVRGNCDYPAEKEYFTYADLKKELPFKQMDAIEIKMTGQQISDLVAFTRSGSYETPPVELAMYSQIDDLMSWDAKARRITRIKNKPIQLQRVYSVAVSHAHASGVDNIVPLVKHCKAHTEWLSPDRATPIREVLVDYCSKCAWLVLLKEGQWGDLDTNGDQKLSRDEVLRAAQRVYGDRVGSVVVRNLMASADFDNDSSISKRELFIVGMLGVVGFFRDEEGRAVLNLDAYHRYVEDFFGESLDDKGSGDREFVEAMFKRLSEANTGGLTRIEELRAVAKSLGRGITI